MFHFAHENQYLSKELRPYFRLYLFFFNITLLSTPAYYVWREEFFIPIIVSLAILIVLKIMIHVKAEEIRKNK